MNKSSLHNRQLKTPFPHQYTTHNLKMKTFTTILLATAALTTSVYAQNVTDFDLLDADDIPEPCLAICRPVVELSTICDIDADLVGGAAAELEGAKSCFCENTSFDVAGNTALCASCVDL